MKAAQAKARGGASSGSPGASPHSADQAITIIPPAAAQHSGEHITPAMLRLANAAAYLWAREFERRNGRPLRVLHIGNIANNAYNNAKIQRNAGIEADVVCYGYYHIMGTPEWEDAEIGGRFADPFLPDWWSVDLGSWQRPEWFIQGPLHLCLNDLRARQSGSVALRRRAKLHLVLDYWAEVRAKHPKPRRWYQLPESPFSRANWATTCRLVGVSSGEFRDVRRDDRRQRIERAITHLIDRLTGWAQRKASPMSYGPRHMAIWQLALNPALARHAASTPPRVSDRLLLGAVHAYRRLRRRPVKVFPPPHGRSVEAVEAMGWAGRLAAIAWHGAHLAVSLIARCLVAAPVDVEQHIEEIEGLAALAELQWRHFPHVAAGELRTDLKHSAALAGPWRDVIGYYDVVQGYSTDGIIPLALGIERYIAYEHGTLREIPFEPTQQGRLCWLTYNRAHRVLVTNSDVLPSIPRIGIPEERVVNLPHAFNDVKLRAFRDANASLVPPPGPPVFFSPTRHHWHTGDGNWLKGNDIFLRAAGRLAAEGRRFRLVLVEWGVEVEKSRALIRELGIEDRVTWLPTMSKRQLWKAYCEAHAVVDQFTLPALGGVAFETLALGRRLITRIDEPVLARFFGKAPPLLNGTTIEDVTASMRAVLDDPDDLAGTGTEARHWIETYHSAERVVALQLAAYRDVVEAR